MKEWKLTAAAECFVFCFAWVFLNSVHSLKEPDSQHTVPSLGAHAAAALRDAAQKNSWHYRQTVPNTPFLTTRSTAPIQQMSHANGPLPPNLP